MRNVDEQIAERNLAGAGRGKLAELTVAVAAAREDDGQIGILVRVGVADAAAEKNGLVLRS